MNLCNTKIHIVFVEPGVFNERKRVKFNLCHVSETNDADLNLLPVFGCPHYAELLLVPGRGEIDHLLTLGKC